ncbi:hypothetical protein THAOC_07180, partial [Thalassiosira oceanica]
QDGAGGCEAAGGTKFGDMLVPAETVRQFVVDKAVLSCFRQEAKIAGGQHAAGKAPDQGWGLDVKVLQHGVGLSSTEEAELHRVHVRAEECHCA